MRVSTIAMLLGAAACAAAAALLTQVWLAARPEPRSPIVVQQTTVPATRTVVVAAVPLKFATVLTPDVLNEVPWPTEHVPADAFASKAALLASGQRTTLGNIVKNEPVLASKVTGPGQRVSLSVMISEGKKAVTIRVDDVLGVAGFVQPDDRVDVLLTRNERATNNAQVVKAAANGVYTDILLQNIRVLAIDQLAERNLTAKPVKAVTLEVETDDAQKLVLAASVGQLSLALRRAGGIETSEPRRIGLEDLPAPRLSEVPASADDIDRGPLVTIIRGAGERMHYNLGAETGRAIGVPLADRQALNGNEAGARRDAGEETTPPVEPR
jgi:pilus assembly protein CpaB